MKNPESLAKEKNLSKMCGDDDKISSKTLKETIVRVLELCEKQETHAKVSI